MNGLITRFAIFTLLIPRHPLRKRERNTIQVCRGLFIPAIILTILFLTSCNPTKYVPEGDYLLIKNKIENEQKKEVSNKDIRSYIRQKPNNRILGIRFNLWMYNISNLEKEKGIHKWLRKVGEAPVIYDQGQNNRSVDQIRSYLDRKGYFDAEVYDSVEYKKKRVTVDYFVDPNASYKIGKITYQIADTTISDYILRDTVNALIKTGDRYDVDALDNERDRIESHLKDQGFYRFQKDRIQYIADSTVGAKTIDLQVQVEPRMVRSEGYFEHQVPYQKYRIRKVYFFVDYDPSEALQNPTTYYSDLDTVFLDGFYFVKKKEKPPLSYITVKRGSYILPGDMYNLTNVQQTRKHLGGLDVMKHVDIYFTDVEHEVSDTGIVPIDCHVQMAQNKLQAYSIELEGTNSSGNFGASVNLLYQHRNLFRRAEVLNFRLKNAYEALPTETQGLGRMTEVGVEADIVFPRFLLPFLRKQDFVKKYNPKTNLLTAYNYQRRPEYERNMAVVNFGYRWQGNAFASHIVTPIDINVIKLPYIDSAWAAHIDTTSYLAYSYKNTFIVGLGYSFIFTNQNIRKKNDYFYLRFNLSTSGNLVSAADRLFNSDVPKTGSEVFGIEYAQYVIADVDFRYHTVINDANSVVYRGFFGVGFPYGNSRALPFEKQFYTGGANDIRAWPARGLGPGSYPVDNTTFYNQKADLKVNGNIEYRFDLFWVLEGALFLDAGNIWAVSREDDRIGAKFSFSSLFSDMAVGTGFGARLDFSFFIFRFDMGWKLRDPQIQSGSKWVIANPGYNLGDLTFHLAIGYPF
jgi:outer membrane protein assembly factor BamA